MYVVFATGGKQHCAQKGQILDVEIMDCKPGDALSWPAHGVSPQGMVPMTVSGEVVEFFKAKKVIVFKKQRRQNHRRKKGHRQHLMRVRITDILAA